MNDPTKIKVLSGLVAILVVLNISIMAFMWCSPHGGRPPRGRDGRGPAGLVIKELNFDETQTKQFEKLREEHHTAVNQIDERNHTLHNALFNTLSAGNEASKTADSLINEIANVQKEKEQTTYRHLSQVRQMCKPDQQKTFDIMIKKAMDRRPQGPPQGDGPPPRD